FTLAVPNNLTEDQKTALGTSFVVALSAADSSGNIVTQTSTVRTTVPTGTTESLTIGANKVVDTKGDTFKVFVRVAKDDKSIEGRSVTLNVNDPISTGVTVSQGTAVTNTDGVATFNLTLENGANVNQAILEKGIGLTATTTTAENTELVQSYIVAVDTATIDNYQILVSADKVTLNTGGDQTNATFRVTDSSGGVLANVPVQLSIENLESSGAALTTPSVVSTDAEGKIDVGILLAANTVDARLNHSVVINAKIITPRYDANGDVTLQVREEKSLSLSAIGTSITLEASETQLKDGESTTISTTLVDGAGIAIANADIELVNVAGEVISTEEVITNASGEASFEINESDLTFDNNGNLRVFVRALGAVNTQRSLTSIDLVKVSQAGISFIDIEDVYDVNKQQTINVQIRADSAAQAQALIGETLEVQTTLGQFKNGNGSDNVILTRRIRATDVAENIITIPVRLRSELAGTTVLEAKVLGIFAPGTNSTLKYQTTIDTRFRATTPAKMLFQAVKSVITPGTSTEVVATVKDENDVPVEGQTVVFSRASDSSAGRLSAATAVTDSRGEARV
ncbi:MAG: Ig-like domain-containing protein, partial [Psychrobacter celer]